MEQLVRLLSAVTGGRLPAHMTDAVHRMLGELAAISPDPLASRLLELRADPAAAIPYDLLPEADASYLDSVLRNTVNATIVRTGDAINVVPSQITVDLDGRILPGHWTVDDYVAELRGLIGADLPTELLVEGEPMPAPVLGSFYDLLAKVVMDADPDGVSVPMLTTASTDARLFASLGITCYGWMPLLAAPGSRYQDAMHAADERIPVEGLRFGAECFYQALARYRCE